MATKKKEYTVKERIAALQKFAIYVTLGEQTKVTAKLTKEEEIGVAIYKMSNVCSGGKRDIANLLSVVLDKKIEVKTPPAAPTIFRAGHVVVPLSNPNSHNYTIDHPCLIYTDGDVAVKSTAVIGNHLPSQSGATRLAKVEEIIAMFIAIEGNVTFLGGLSKELVCLEGEMIRIGKAKKIDFYAA